MKKQRKMYERPHQPFSAERFAHEKELINNYGLRRKKEIWRVEAILRGFRRRARDLAAKHDKEAEGALLKRVQSLGLIGETATLDDVLALSMENLLERRLQTVVVRKGLAKTMRQARQFIVHGHIAIEGRYTRWPSMLITKDMEPKITFYEKSKIKGWIEGGEKAKPAEK